MGINRSFRASLVFVGKDDGFSTPLNLTGSVIGRGTDGLSRSKEGSGFLIRGSGSSSDDSFGLEQSRILISVGIEEVKCAEKKLTARIWVAASPEQDSSSESES